jgi:hypothetical protein
MIADTTFGVNSAAVYGNDSFSIIFPHVVIRTASINKQGLQNHVKRTGVARRPLRKGEKLRQQIEKQLQMLQKMPSLVRSFSQTPSVAYIGNC